MFRECGNNKEMFRECGNNKEMFRECGILVFMS